MKPTPRSSGTLIVMGEAAKRLGEPFHEANPQIPWRGVISQRNFLAHGYDIVDWNLITTLIERDLPTFVQHIRALLSKFEPSRE